VSARFTVQWTQTAVDDLLSIIDYVVDRDGTEAAERLYGQITHGVAGLETMPFDAVSSLNSRLKGSMATARCSWARIG
jgi:plasmid stabilization system protein ParE